MARNGKLLASWNFKGRDPQADVLQTVYQDHHIKEDHLAAMARLAPSTVKNFFSGKTQRAQFWTYQKIAHALGKHYTLSGDLVPNYNREIPKALAERKQYRQRQKKKKERAERRANS